MLTHPLLERLSRLRLNGMLSALKEQVDMPQIGRPVENLPGEIRELNLLLFRDIIQLF
jgi:hypothetical protein